MEWIHSDDRSYTSEAMNGLLHLSVTKVAGQWEAVVGGDSMLVVGQYPDREAAIHACEGMVRFLMTNHLEKNRTRVKAAKPAQPIGEQPEIHFTTGEYLGTMVGTHGREVKLAYIREILIHQRPRDLDMLKEHRIIEEDVGALIAANGQDALVATLPYFFPEH